MEGESKCRIYDVLDCSRFPNKISPGLEEMVSWFWYSCLTFPFPIGKCKCLGCDVIGVTNLWYRFSRWVSIRWIKFKTVGESCLRNLMHFGLDLSVCRFGTQILPGRPDVALLMSLKSHTDEGCNCANFVLFVFRHQSRDLRHSSTQVS